jgi:hypothetical protein
VRRYGRWRGGSGLRSVEELLEAAANQKSAA